jgi:hypothetical protein
LIFDKRRQEGKEGRKAKKAGRQRRQEGKEGRKAKMKLDTQPSDQIPVQERIVIVTHQYA